MVEVFRLIAEELLARSKFRGNCQITVRLSGFWSGGRRMRIL